ncbi:glycosyltransferase family 4 protein [Hydrogenimonas sp.]
MAIESDTQPKKDKGFKGAVKRFILQTIFKNDRLLGFAGGAHKHKEYFRKYGMAEERIFLMPMMVNNETFFADRPKPDSPFTFLYVGRIIPHKNVQMLVESFQKAFNGKTDVLLRIVGRGSSLESLRSRYGDAPNIRFEGAKFGRDLVETYHTSHVLVIPSLYEPWGLVVNEAMAAGLPVLASDRVGAVGDLVREGETGFIFDPERVDELGELMQKIRNDRVLYETLASRAETLMCKEWNYELYRTGLLEALAFIRRQKERRTP